MPQGSVRPGDYDDCGCRNPRCGRERYSRGLNPPPRRSTVSRYSTPAKVRNRASMVLRFSYCQDLMDVAPIKRVTAATTFCIFTKNIFCGALSFSAIWPFPIAIKGNFKIPENSVFGRFLMEIPCSAASFLQEFLSNSCVCQSGHQFDEGLAR